MNSQGGSLGSASRWGLGARVAGGTAVGAMTLAAAAASAAAVFARLVVTPVGERRDDVVILSSTASTVTLEANPMTVQPGQYGVWLAQGAGHIRLGRVVEVLNGRVTRELHAVDSGELLPGPGRWNQYYFAGPPTQSLGLAHEDVAITTALGEMPAWQVPDETGMSTSWAILIHGRGATREECLRAIPVMHRLGYQCLVVSYRNDRGVPASPEARYTLGMREWEDVEQALDWVADQGASDIVVAGWSMGGAIALQLAAQAKRSDLIRGIVLDAPVLDWGSVLEHHARVNHLPAGLGRLTRGLMGNEVGRRAVGVAHPLNLDALNWVQRAGELTKPMLIIHSADDEFVPVGPSRAVARARPDLVIYAPSSGALHCKEWNLDPQDWEATVARFLLAL